MSDFGALSVSDSELGVRERLIGSEECYRLFFEHHPQPMAIHESSSLRFLDVNEAAAALYGYSKAEFLDMTVRDLSLWPGAATDATDVATGAAGAAGAASRDQAIQRHVRKDRTPLDVEIWSRELLLPDTPGPKAVRLLVIHDRTEQLRVETERSILEARFRQAQKLELVRTAPKATAAADARDEIPPMLRIAGGDEWILVVEDDPRLRSLAEQILETRGYRVLSAGDGREAAAQLASHGAKLSLLLTDVVLPDTNGRELANRALKAWPALAVIYMSGYIDNVAIPRGADTPQAFLAKPFTAVGLLDMVRKTLDTAQARVKTR